MPPPRLDPMGLKDVAAGALKVDAPNGPEGTAGVEDAPPKGILVLEPNDDPPKEGAELPKGAFVEAMPPNIPALLLDVDCAGNPNDGPCDDAGKLTTDILELSPVSIVELGDSLPIDEGAPKAKLEAGAGVDGAAGLVLLNWKDMEGTDVDADDAAEKEKPEVDDPLTPPAAPNIGFVAGVAEVFVVEDPKEKEDDVVVDAADAAGAIDPKAKPLLDDVPDVGVEPKG